MQDDFVIMSNYILPSWPFRSGIQSLRCRNVIQPEYEVKNTKRYFYLSRRECVRKSRRFFVGRLLDECLNTC